MIPDKQLLEIRERDPLKQGLKRFNKPLLGVGQGIHKQDPLKQGLKPGGFV